MKSAHARAVTPVLMETRGNSLWPAGEKQERRQRRSVSLENNLGMISLPLFDHQKRGRRVHQLAVGPVANPRRDRARATKNNRAVRSAGGNILSLNGRTNDQTLQNCKRYKVECLEECLT